jgi:hypothetical protein
MKKLLVFVSAFLIFSKPIFPADTLKVMHYNLMYYDKNTSFCTSTNNNVDNKDGYLRTIVGHYKPDIFTANEINGSPTSVQRILTNVFNVDGVDYFKRGNYQGDYLVNMLYYNSNKLVLKYQSYVLTSPRITDVYTLYLKTEDLVKGDTIFFTCFVSHHKAGNTTSDATDRATAVQQIMSYITNRNIKGNVMAMGDFNFYTSSEAGFQKYITPTSTGFRFFDPVDAMGSWQDNPIYAPFHTQSTHTSGGCFSGGGMDDRFDFILTSLDILQQGGLTYVEDSYWAYGQDGNRLNQPLTSATNPNYSLPSNIINALYNMSDHIPVTLKLLYNQQTSSTGLPFFNERNIRINGMVYDNVEILYSGATNEKVSVNIVNIIGVPVIRNELVLEPGMKSNISAIGLSSGVYLVVVNGSKGKFVAKIIKH